MKFIKTGKNYFCEVQIFNWLSGRDGKGRLMMISVPVGIFCMYMQKLSPYYCGIYISSEKSVFSSSL